MRFGSTMTAFALAGLTPAQAGLPAAGGLGRCVAAVADRADFSGTVLIDRDGAPVVRIDRGVLAGPGSAAIGRDTRFNLGSSSKMFTAVAIGQLVERGRLRLDQPVGEVVAGLTPAAGRVTIRQLLDHTSGLGDFFRPENMEAMLKARTASDILPLIAGDTPSFEPGSRFAYSNSGFALLGVAIERVSGLTYGEYLRRNVFGPAGMSRSGLDPQPLTTLAVGMTRGGMRPPAATAGPAGPSAGPGDAPPAGGLVLIGPDGKRIDPAAAGAGSPPPGGLVLIGPDGRRIDPSTMPGGPAALRPAPGATEGYGSPAGGLFSTADDMTRFAKALGDGRLLSRAMFDQFTSAQVEAAPAADGRPARHYGLGFGIAEDGGRRWVGHNGGTLGANAEVWFEPHDGWSVTVLTNRDPPVATEMARRIRPLLGSSAPAGCGGGASGNANG